MKDNAKITREYFTAIKGIDRSPESLKILSRLQEEVNAEITSKGKQLRGIGDSRLGTLFSKVIKELKKTGNKGVFVFNNKTPTHKLHIDLGKKR